MKLNPTTPFALLLLFAAAPAFAQDEDAARLAIGVCAACHGPRGESVAPAFPRLAAQRAEYIESQLKSFRDRTRSDPMAQGYMWGMTSQLSDGTIAGLAEYYSKQKPVRNGQQGNPKLLQEGKTIYEQGIPATNVPACITCHGKDAEGSAVYPRLAGQHAPYLVKQIALFKSALRADPNAAVMHAISAGMSFEQAEAVAAYLASK